MNKKLIRLTESDLHNIIKETINTLFNNKMDFIGTCIDFDADDVQYITHWDEYCENEYAIQDEYFNNGIIEIVDTNKMLSLVCGEKPDISEIDYCAYNNDVKIGWIYTTNDIHYFYK